MRSMWWTVTTDHWLIGLVLLGNLYLTVLTLLHVRQLRAQVAVLTIRTTDIYDAIGQFEVVKDA